MIKLKAGRGFIKDSEYVASVNSILNSILNSSQFEGRVLSSVFSSARKMSNADILGNLRSDVEVTLYLYKTWKFWSKVVGYFSGGNVIYCNQKYWLNSSALSNASFIMHETAHMKGFTHRSASDRTSVPYTLNRIVVEVGHLLGY